MSNAGCGVSFHGMAPAARRPIKAGPVTRTLPMQAFTADAFLIDDLRQSVDERLDRLVPHCSGGSSKVSQAVRYALLAPGKRIRPLLTLLAATEFGAEVAAALDVACATEMVHTASLVLDDLPSMDDAVLRRGQPTTHVRFGESIAILAAVALLNQAFSTIVRSPHLLAETRVALVERMSDAIGFDGLVSGQEIDLDERSSGATLGRLEALNRQKTGVLFEAALELGARVAGVRDRRISALRQAAAHLGLAYQIADDLFDTPAALSARPSSKDRNKDRGKPTVVSLLGVERAQERIGHHLSEALNLLPGEQDGSQFLRGYVSFAFSPARMC